MPYHPGKKRQRALYVSDETWDKFKAVCHGAGMTISACLNQFIDEVNEGSVRLDRPRKVLLRFAERRINVDHREDMR